MEIKAPYLPYEVLRQRAEEFLLKHHPSREIPVPIEEIVEFQFKMDIVPEPGLHANFDIDAYITRDLTEIRVDDFVYQERPGRYRFSLAHELGHRVLHKEVFSKLAFETIDGWKDVISEAIPAKQYSFLESQANSFAGLVLVPPDKLEEQFNASRRKVEGQGFSFQANSDVLQDLIPEYLADFFEVSGAVVDRRLNYDQLWERAT